MPLLPCGVPRRVLQTLTAIVLLVHVVHAPRAAKAPTSDPVPAIGLALHGSLSPAGRRGMQRVGETCTADAFPARVADVMASCCPGGSSECELPETCPSAGCAGSFGHFWEDCQGIVRGCVAREVEPRT